MGRMIDTDAAYAVLTDYYHHSTDAQHEALREALGRVESVDAVPVRHGWWENIERREPLYDISGEKTWGVACRCSECGFVHTVIEDFGYYSFCPSCGAKMDGKGDGNETD